MTDISATVAVPVSQLATANLLGSSGEGEPWHFSRALTDTQGGTEITHYGASGAADAVMLALIVSLPGVLVMYPEDASAALEAWGLYRWVDPNE